MWPQAHMGAAVVAQGQAPPLGFGQHGECAEVRVRNGVFLAISVNENATVISDCSPSA